MKTYIFEDLEDLKAIEDRKSEKGIKFEKYFKKRFKNKNAFNVGKQN